MTPEETQIVFAKLQRYEDAVRFLLREIENIVTDGDEFDFDKADKVLRPIGIIVEEEYFQP